jgi:hypothetical protein
MSRVTRDDILMGRDVKWPLTVEQEMELTKLLASVQGLFSSWHGEIKVSSGYRPAAVNTQVPGAAKKSAHMSCQAVDLYDPGRNLAHYLLDNVSLLDKWDMYLEDPAYTPTWVHVQTRRTRSGRRIFKP